MIPHHSLVEMFGKLPIMVQFSCDATVMSTALLAFLGAMSTPVATLAAIAALAYTVLRVMHLIKHWGHP